MGQVRAGGTQLLTPSRRAEEDGRRLSAAPVWPCGGAATAARATKRSLQPRQQLLPDIQATCPKGPEQKDHPPMFPEPCPSCPPLSGHQVKKC